MLQVQLQEAHDVGDQLKALQLVRNVFRAALAIQYAIKIRPQQVFV